MTQQTQTAAPSVTAAGAAAAHGAAARGATVHDTAAPRTAAASTIDAASVFPYRRCADQDAQAPVHHPIVVIGAGPVGLSMAIDLALRGQPVLLLDNDDRLSTGSRAICFAKRTLEIFDRLGCGDAMVTKGVSWNTGKVFFREGLVYQFDLQADPGHERPAFINLQQYHLEAYLVERALSLPLIQLRWKNQVSGLSQDERGVTLTVDTPDGPYRIAADYVIACDGSRSTTRQLLGLESKGQVFRDRFLIADVKMTADFPSERWFWFDPPFHPNQSVLLHKQADDVWRIDFQLGWEADPEEEKKPENILPRVRALLGPQARFELEWASVYTFACLRMEHFRHGRVLFAGDAAHGVSPFGARGANSGVQDADNLGWKLDAVLRRSAPVALLDTYAEEREYAADENIRHSTRSTDFITPKSPISRMFRDAVLDLARDFPFARALVNSGRLSLPTVHAGSRLNTADAAQDAFGGLAAPGAAAIDAPVRADGEPGWFVRQLPSSGFTMVLFAGPRSTAMADELRTLARDPAAPFGLKDLHVLVVDPAPAERGRDAFGTALVDAEGWLARRYDAQPDTAYLFRPDQHVAARWRHPTVELVRRAIARATAADDVGAAQPLAAAGVPA